MLLDKEGKQFLTASHAITRYSETVFYIWDYWNSSPFFVELIDE